MSRAHIKRWIFGAIAAFLLLALVVPFINADHYREATRHALETALGRKVEIDSVRFRLLPQPGLTIGNVIIGEDPAIGAEPVAYVTTMRAIPRILPLLEGRLELSSVDLEDASLTLTRVDRPDSSVSWNFAALMRLQALSRFPVVHLHGGRINFKFGDTKSIFYLLDTDLDLWPPDSPRDGWTLRIKGEPARTDRPARGFGSFVLRGEWHPETSSAILDVRLEKSELGDMLTLFNGYESGIQGSISGNAHLAGPANHIGLSGTIMVSNLHGWSQSPPGGNEWPMAVGGVLDASGQTIDVVARLNAKQSPIELHYRASGYLRRPQWGVTATLNKFPIAPVIGIARNFGFAIPADFKLDGTADGAVGVSLPQSATQMNGSLLLSNSVFSVSGAPPLKIPAAALRFGGTLITLGPTAITNENNETATLGGSWDTADNSVDAQLSSDGMAIASLSRQVSLAGIPLLSQATAGVWRGKLRYSDSEWSGDVHIEDTVIPFEAFADPLRIVSADAGIDGSMLSVKRLVISAGGIDATGEYRYEPAAARPHRFRLSIAQANADAIEKLMMPALHRGNFFTYAFNFGRGPEPDWLHNMRADGVLQIGSLILAGNEFTKVKARVLWDATELKLQELQCAMGPAALAGSLALHLDRRQPTYDVEGKLTGLPWHSGHIDTEGSLVTSGTGSALLDHLRAKGTFEGKGIDLTPLDTYESVAGAFEWVSDARNPRLRLTQLTMKNGTDTYQGTGESQDNGQVLVKITDGPRHFQAAVTP